MPVIILFFIFAVIAAGLVYCPLKSKTRGGASADLLIALVFLFLVRESILSKEGSGVAWWVSTHFSTGIQLLLVGIGILIVFRKPEGPQET